VGLHPGKFAGLRVRNMPKRHFSPPPLAERLVGRALDEEERSVRLGDLEERYQYLVRERSERRARAWYRRQALQLLILAVFNHILWSGIMFKNNLVIAWRNIKRNKIYSALNIFGLAVGMAVFILIMLYVRYELSYDRYHENSRNIYRIIQQQPGNVFLGSDIFAVTPPPVAPALLREFPEVSAATRISRSSDVLVSVGEKKFMEKQFYWADPQTFEIFSFSFVRGDRATAFKDPFSLLLSEREAHRFFGSADPVGQTISGQITVGPYKAQMAEFRVTGVFRNIPANSHFVMDIVAPFEALTRFHRDLTSWGYNFVYTYVLLKDGADGQALERKLPAFADKYAAGKIWTYKGQPSRYLVIACINYMNLATARSLKRTKEVGLRKVVGAAKGQLIRQFIGDSMVLTFLALLLAVGSVLLVLPAFSAFVERDIAFNPLRDLSLIPGLVILAAAVGVAAGSYPAFFVSAFRPVSALKSTGFSKSKGRGLRNALIVFQFAASVALIICTVGVRSQLSFIRNKDMGYERDQILVLTSRGGLQTNIEAFKTELKRNPAILNVAASGCFPHTTSSDGIAHWPGRPDSLEIPIYNLSADYDYVDVYGMRIVRGRNFSRDFLSDAGGAFLINESAQKAIGWEDPIGRDFCRWAGAKPAGKIVGVIKDFHMRSLHIPIGPLYVFLDPKIDRNVSIKIRAENIPATLDFIEKTWERFAPEYPFEYSFFDDIFDQDYRAERRLGTIFSVFGGLAILIACLGLLGLASFTAEQKTKEIGIRKVLGASTSGVIALLSREFMKWVVLANLIAWPIGYFAMRSWLRNFAYRTNLPLPMFLVAALAAFAIAATVISLQTYRAASANPADSLRYE
jgi:putative ABC transport system permease protein